MTSTEQMQILTDAIDAHVDRGDDPQMICLSSYLRDALTAVLELHQPSQKYGAVVNRWKRTWDGRNIAPGECIFCNRTPLIRVAAAGVYPDQAAHYHVDPHPDCQGCGSDMGDPWPCDTVQAIAEALEVKL